MRVLKFGSATISNAEKIRHIVSLIESAHNDIVVFSSIKGTAEFLEEISQYFYNKNAEGAVEVVNELEKFYKQLIVELYTEAATREKALLALSETIEYIKSFADEMYTLFEHRALMAQGELISLHLINLLLQEMKLNTYILPALDFMRIDRNWEPDMVFIKEYLNRLLNEAPKDCIYLTQGYICRNAYGEIDDLHKGGSDYTASIIGAVVKASEIQIWSEVDVMQNNDPFCVQNIQTVDCLCFDEAAELTYFGAKILHPTCVLPAKLAGVPIRLKNTQKPDAKGTLISKETQSGVVKAIGVRDNITAIRIKSGKMLLAHGFLRRIFEVFDKYQTSIDMLATSEVGVSLTIDDPKNQQAIIEELKQYGSVVSNSNMVIVSIIGDQVVEDENLRSRIWDSLKHIPVSMVSYGGSHFSFSFLINQIDKKHVLEILNKKIFESKD